MKPGCFKGLPALVLPQSPHCQPAHSRPCQPFNGVHHQNHDKHNFCRQIAPQPSISLLAASIRSGGRCFYAIPQGKCFCPFHIYVSILLLSSTFYPLTQAGAMRKSTPAAPATSTSYGKQSAPLQAAALFVVSIASPLPESKRENHSFHSMA